jgi:hypothetical protein
MKKILVALLVLALAIPAMADVAVTWTDMGGGHLQIKVAPTVGASVRGVALVLERTAGDATVASTAAVTATGLNTFIDYALTAGAGYTAIGQGHPAAKWNLPGGVATFPAESAKFSLCAGYLDENGVDPKGEGLTVDSFFDVFYDITTDSTITIALDTLRGGIVGDTLGTVTVASPAILDVQEGYTLTASVGTPSGTVTDPGIGAFGPYTGSKTIVAQADANYHFVNWTGTGVTAGKVANPNAASTTILMDADYTVVANFAINVYNLTTSVGTPSGTVTTPGIGVFPYNAGLPPVSIVATPALNNKFVNWTGTGVDAGKVASPTSASTTITMDGDYTAVANFVKKTCREMLTTAEQVEYDKYIAAGKTDAQMVSWCWRFQCRGDADNQAYQPTTLKWQIYQGDMNIMIAQWKKTYATSTNVAADFDHMSYQPASLKWTVYQGDMNIMIANWKKTPTTLVECPSYLP